MSKEECTIDTCKKVDCPEKDCHIRDCTTDLCSKCEKRTLDEYQCTGICLDILCPECRNDTKTCKECKGFTCNDCIKSMTYTGEVQVLEDENIICNTCLDEMRNCQRQQEHKDLIDFIDLMSRVLPVKNDV